MKSYADQARNWAAIEAKRVEELRKKEEDAQKKIEETVAKHEARVLEETESMERQHGILEEKRKELLF